MNNPFELGTDEHGIRFDWKRTDPHIESHGALEIDLWWGEWNATATITLDAGQALELAQWLNDQLGRE